MRSDGKLEPQVSYKERRQKSALSMLISCRREGSIVPNLSIFSRIVVNLEFCVKFSYFYMLETNFKTLNSI